MAEQPPSDKARQILALAQQAALCPACDLAQTRTNVVFGDGNPDSPLMLVGEGPGANEDATGLPFVGRAGKLLDECLREAGMLRKHVYITNVVKCRPTLEEMGKIKNRPPRADEIGACVPLWLEKQIAVVQPAVILCLGAPAANTLIHRNFKMMQERGPSGPRRPWIRSGSRATARRRRRRARHVRIGSSWAPSWPVWRGHGRRRGHR